MIEHWFVKWLSALMKVHHTSTTIKLLNVGTDNEDEYHWRFRDAFGDVYNVSITREKP